MNEPEITLFPLNTVLFPGGPLPLRIFEARYVDMVSACLREDCGFGVNLIESGDEVGQAADTYHVGTLSRIMDWHQRHDGLLGITVVGEQRYRIISREVQPNRLTRARVELLPNDPETELPAEYIPMADFLRQLIKQVPHLYASLPHKYHEAAWVGGRLTELLPLPLEQKQRFLEINAPIQRLERLRDFMEEMRIQY